MFIHASTRVRCCAQHPILEGGGAALVPRIRPQGLPPRSQHLRSEAWSLLCILKLSHCANAGKEPHQICNIVHLLSSKPLETRQSKQGECRIYVLEKLLLDIVVVDHLFFSNFANCCSGKLSDCCHWSCFEFFKLSFKAIFSKLSIWIIHFK